MAVLGRIADFKPPEGEDSFRIIAATLIALGFHVLLFQALMFKTPEVFEVKEDFITVELVSLPPTPQAVESVEEPSEIPEIEDAPLPPPPKAIPRPKPTPPPTPTITTQAPDILASSRAATAEDVGNTVPLSEAGITPSPTPPERSADDIRIDEGLKALAVDLRCLNGFSTDCADIRKDVFKDLQLTETEKVYTKKYAHTGLPSQFYGLSERQIREKLNLKFAGENGIVIIPGLLALDGDLWDAMHGVNKKCEWKFAATSAQSNTSRHGSIKDCPNYLPAAKEDRDRRNKFQVQLEANEARRDAEKDNE